MTNGGAAAVAFTTGNADTGYTLTSITTKFAANDKNPSGFSATLHDASGDNPGTLKATLSGNAPTAAGNYTYTCSGCTLTNKDDIPHTVRRDKFETCRKLQIGGHFLHQ